jgi:hypothetical protein
MMLIRKQKDDSIPTRASKGKKSKKAVRDEVRRARGLTDRTGYEDAKEELKQLSIKSKWTCGKW